MHELILVRGLPGSGKSTFAKKLSRYIHVEADHYFIDTYGVYRFDAQKLKDAHQWCLTRTKSILLQEINVVVSNTFSQYWEIAPYFKLAQELQIPYTVVEMKNRFQNIHNVPDSIIAKMLARWEDINHD